MVERFSDQDIEHAYNILGCRVGDGRDKIKESYRQLAKKYHPDMAEGDKDRFIEINNAYNLLNKYLENPDNDYANDLYTPEDSPTDSDSITYHINNASTEGNYKVLKYMTDSEKNMINPTNRPSYWEKFKDGITKAGNWLADHTYRSVGPSSAAKELEETVYHLGKARDVYYNGILETKAQQQHLLNEIDEQTGGIFSLMDIF